MSARVLNPMLMTDMRSGLAGGRVVPTKAELAPIRRDLFGPVDHAANRALVERELKAQSRLDAERWGFDFQLGLPRRDDRYAWEVVRPTDVVPEPYALRGMPYLRKHAPGTPRKLTSRNNNSTSLNSNPKSNAEPTTKVSDQIDDATPRNAEMTPPQELRVPAIGNRDGETTPEDRQRDDDRTNVKHSEDPTTPILPPSARKQSAITDFMPSRKRSLKGSSKSILEPSKKISPNTGKIRS